MSGLLGRHEFQIDAKGRVSLPSAFRRAVSANPLVLLQWQPTHLDLFPRETWAEIRGNLLAHRKARNDRGAYLRRITASAVEIEPDAHGRIRIPAWLLEQAGLEDTVLFVGALDRIELWRPESFEAHLREREEEEDGFATQIFG